METWDALRARRNVRRYDDRPIPDEVLDRILEAARRSPSSRNRQRWDVVVVTERPRLEALSQVWRGAGHVARSAATIALVIPTESEESETRSVHYDLGQLTIMTMLAATDQGVGSAHASVHEQDKAREVLELPPDRTCAWLIALGYPADGPLRPLERVDRRPLDEVVHRESW